MSDDTSATDRRAALLLGGVLGALAGLGAAYLYLQAREKSGGEVKLRAGEGVKLGLLVLGLMRSVAQLGERD